MDASNLDIRMRKATGIPIDIVDMIVHELIPRPGSFWSSPRSLISCASVSRLWRRITLPYLFRTVKVRGRFNNTTSCRFYSFLVSNPLIAQFVKDLFLLRLDVDVQTLHWILAKLPNLRCLYCSETLLHGQLWIEEAGRGSRQYHKIDRLVYGGDACCRKIPDADMVCSKQVTKLLSLFSEIGEFRDQSDCPHTDRAESPLPRLEGLPATIRSLDITKFRPGYYNDLHHLGLVEHLTCLHLSNPQSGNLLSLNRFLCVVGHGLQELYLGLIIQGDTTLDHLLEPNCKLLIV